MKVVSYLVIALAIIIGAYLVIAGAASLIDDYDGGMRDMIAFGITPASLPVGYC